MLISDCSSDVCASDLQLRDFTQGALGNFTNNGAIYSRSIEVDEVKGLATIHAKGVGNLWWNRDEEHPYLAIEGMVGDFNVDIDRSRPAWRDIPVATGNPMLMEYRFSLTLPQGAAFTTEGDARVDREIAGFAMRQIGRATCRERVCTYGMITVVAG